MWMNLTTSTNLLIHSSKTFAQNLIHSHGTDGVEQGRILGHHDESTQNATGVMPALSSRNTSTGFLWHFPVNKVDCNLMYDNALCRLLISFFSPAGFRTFWLDSERGGIKWRCWKSCFQYRSPTHLIPTSGYTQACVPGFHSTSLIPQCCWTTHKPGWFMDLVLAPSPFKMCHLLPGGPGPFREQQSCSATVAEAPPRDTACHPSHKSGLKSQTQTGKLTFS